MDSSANTYDGSGLFKGRVYLQKTKTKQRHSWGYKIKKGRPETAGICKESAGVCRSLCGADNSCKIDKKETVGR